MSTTEAADLARIILDDSEADLPNDLYTLNVHEARTLAGLMGIQPAELLGPDQS